MNIEANDLLLFARIVDSGSFSRAAELTGLPKSTVSRRLTELENQVGERLLQRTTRKLVLTELGSSLLEHARQLAIEVEAAITVVQHRQVLPSGRLRISTPHDLASAFLCQHLAVFRERYPAISIDIDLSPRRVDMYSEKFDLAIRMGDLPDDTNLVARRIAQFSVGIYAAPSYLANNGYPEHPDQLKQHHILSILGQNSHETSWLLHSGNQHWQGVLSSVIAANSPEFLIRLAIDGIGITNAPCEYALKAVSRGELVRVLPAWQFTPITAWAVFPERKLLPAKTRVFLEFLDQIMPKNSHV